MALHCAFCKTMHEAMRTAGPTAHPRRQSQRPKLEGCVSVTRQAQWSPGCAGLIHSQLESRSQVPTCAGMLTTVQCRERASPLQSFDGRDAFDGGQAV